MTNQPTLANIWYKDDETPTLLVTNYVRILGEWQPQTTVLCTAPDRYRYVQALGGNSGILPSGHTWKIETVQIENVPNILELIDEYVDRVLLAPLIEHSIITLTCRALTARNRIKEYLG